jgi:hypothetical protein
VADIQGVSAGNRRFDSIKHINLFTRELKFKGMAAVPLSDFPLKRGAGCFTNVAPLYHNPPPAYVSRALSSLILDFYQGSF